jgi:hypothetical protein
VSKSLLKSGVHVVLGSSLISGAKIPYSGLEMAERMAVYKFEKVLSPDSQADMH